MNTERAQEAVAIIDAAFKADNFNEGDREEIERSRKFFDTYEETVRAVGGQTLLSTKLVA